MRSQFASLLTLFSALIAWTMAASGLRAEAPRVLHREPIRILADGDQLLVFHRRGGSVSRVDLASRSVTGEWPLGERLADAQRLELPGQPWWIACDEGANELLLLARRTPMDSAKTRGLLETETTESAANAASVATPITVVTRLPVEASPTHLAIVPGTGEFYASLRWAQRLADVELQPAARVRSNATRDAGAAEPVAAAPTAPELVYRRTLDLPFCPGPLIVSPDRQHLVVADAFGPHLAVVQRDPLRVVAVLRIPGHNIGGMAWNDDGSELQFTHAMLNDFIPTTRDHVFWGNVVSNMLRVLPRDELLRERPESLAEPHRIHGSLFPLGREGHAAGDPGAMLVTARGDLAIAIRGTHELALRRHGQRGFLKQTVAEGPSALWASPDGRTLAVASRFADTLTFLDVDSLEPTHVLSLGFLPEPSLAERGERLFHDARLSLDGWFSCHSCHTDGHTIGLSNDNFGDGQVGAPKRIPSLLGTRGTEPWAWNGSQSYLAGQVRKSLEQTMRSTERKQHPVIDERWVDAITAYLETLPAPPSRAEARATRGRSRSVPTESTAAAIERGRQLFADRDCVQCHAPPAYTSTAMYDVGLVDERGTREFNPPSLRGASQRFQFLHDGRARSVREVLQQHPARPGIDERLGPEDQDDLAAFLETL